MRYRSHLAASFAIVFVAAMASAQPVPPQPTGMVGPLNPVLFTQDGIPDGTGDLPGILEFFDVPPVVTGGLQRTIRLNFGDIDCNGSPTFQIEGASSQTGEPFEQFGRAPGEVAVVSFDTFDAAHPRPTSAVFDESGGSGVGSASLVDSNGDHAYEQMTVGGSNGSGPVAATLDIQTYDGNGDGLADFATFFDPAPADPQFNLGVLQFFGLQCDSSPNPYTQAWVPVGRDLDGDPAIIGDLDGNGIADPEFYFGPKLQIGGPVVQIPTLSGFGLAALAGVLLLVGLGLMRRRGFAAGV